MICKAYATYFIEHFHKYIFIILFLHSTQPRERENSYETIITGGHAQYINMADNSHHYDVIGYRNEGRQESFTYDSIVLTSKHEKANIPQLSIANL